jgi:hypothetical protein
MLALGLAKMVIKKQVETYFVTISGRGMHDESGDRS